MSKRRQKSNPIGRPRNPLPEEGGKMTPAARFAKAIRDKREAKGITAAAAADAAGLSLSRWYDIEAGRLDSPPVLDTIQSIASAVGADVVELATLALELVKQR